MDAVVGAFRPDVVHLHNVYHQLSPSVLKPLAERGIPALMTLHDYKLACPSYLFLDHGNVCEACLDGRFRHAVTRRCKDGSLGASAVLALESRLHRTFGAYSSVGAFVCPSRFLAGRMATAGVYPERLRVLSNFVDVDTVATKARPGGGVVYAGRLSHEKGVDVLVEAVGLLGQARLDIAGDGPERSALEALAAARAPGRVRFHGRLPRDEMLSVLRSAAVAVMPSRCHENQPMAVLEAFASGLPVVVTSLGGMPELVEPGADGQVVPSGNPAAMAAAIAGLLAEPERGLAMGRAARAKAERAYAPARHVERLDELYRGLAGVPA
jgi:glycosyltransferase involved in cell wall biosynthesis